MTEENRWDDCGIVVLNKLSDEELVLHAKSRYAWKQAIDNGNFEPGRRLGLFPEEYEGEYIGYDGPLKGGQIRTWFELKQDIARSELSDPRVRHPDDRGAMFFDSPPWFEENRALVFMNTWGDVFYFFELDRFPLFIQHVFLWHVMVNASGHVSRVMCQPPRDVYYNDKRRIQWWFLPMEDRTILFSE